MPNKMFSEEPEEPFVKQICKHTVVIKAGGTTFTINRGSSIDWDAMAELWGVKLEDFTDTSAIIRMAEAETRKWDEYVKHRKEKMHDDNNRHGCTEDCPAEPRNLHSF